MSNSGDYRYCEKCGSMLSIGSHFECSKGNLYKGTTFENVFETSKQDLKEEIAKRILCQDDVIAKLKSELQEANDLIEHLQDKIKSLEAKHG